MHTFSGERTEPQSTFRSKIFTASWARKLKPLRSHKEKPNHVDTRANKAGNKSVCEPKAQHRDRANYGNVAQPNEKRIPSEMPILLPVGKVLITGTAWRFHPSTFAASFAKYVTIKSAPARRMLSRLSSIARSGSSQPRWKAAWSIEYSPET